MCFFPIQYNFIKEQSHHNFGSVHSLSIQQPYTLYYSWLGSELFYCNCDFFQKCLPPIMTIWEQHV